jgi:hypothetical protein
MATVTLERGIERAMAMERDLSATTNRSKNGFNILEPACR